MIAGLVRRHQLIRDLPRAAVGSVVVAALGANVLGFMVAFHERRGQDMDAAGALLVLEFVALASLGVFALKVDPGRRCRHWEGALPLDGRSLWTAHWLALTIAAVTVVLLAAAPTLGMLLLMREKLPLSQLPDAAVARFVYEPAAMAVAAAALLASWRPHLARPDLEPGWRRRLLLALGVLLLGLAAVARWAWLLPVLLVVVVGLALRAGRRVGPALTWIGSADGRGTGPVDTAWMAGPSRRVAWLTQGRLLSKWPMSWIIGLPMTLLFGLVLGGLAPDPDDEPWLRWGNVAMSAYILLAFTAHFVENLGRVDHLPLSRRTLMNWMLLPGLLTLCVGYGAARVIDQRSEPGEPFVFVDEGEHYGLRVSPVLWRPSASADVDPITAPWGETAEPRTQAVLRGLPWSIYKPYTTPAGASERFVAWQLSRAIRDWSGVEIAPDELAEAYFVTGDDGIVRLRGDSLTVAADRPELAGLSGGPVFPVLMASVLVLTLLCCTVYFRTHRAGATVTRTRVTFWLLMAGLLIAHVSGFGMLMADVTEDWVISCVVFGTLRAVGAAGAVGWVVAWLAAVAVSAAAWRLALSGFARVEALPVRKTDC